MSTTIVITPPGAAPITLTSYEKCTTRTSSQDHAGEFSIDLKEFDSDLVDVFVFGSDVVITQDGHVFRGWVMDQGKSIIGNTRFISITGADYKAKTQKILITETYTDKTIDYIVSDLFSTYVTWSTGTNIETCSQVLTIKFADKFLWEVMEQLCKISGFEWYIDENLDVHFFQPETRISAFPLSTNLYYKGSAKLKPVYNKMVNKLWVKGGKAISDDFTQAITVGTAPIPLLYTPRATTDGVVVTIGGVEKTIGIQNVDKAGTKDFLLNYSEKLLVPDLLTTGTGTIVYTYEYPIKILFSDPISQEQYGVFEDIYNVDTNDRLIAIELGKRYLLKYSQPVITGSIAPINNIYHPGELVYVTIPKLNIDGYLQIKSVEYDSRNKISRVDRSLQIESPERDIQSIIKTLNTRVSKLEKNVMQDDNTTVEMYISRDESTEWTEEITEYTTIVDYCSTTLFVGGMHS